jgi:hypothetical protein
MHEQPLSVTVVGGDGVSLASMVKSLASMVNCGAPVIMLPNAAATAELPKLSVGFPASCHVHDHVREAMAVHAPDEAYRVWCPNCGYVLAEYLHGVARYLCRSCKWEGVIARHSAFLVVSYTTLRRGAAETQWRKRPPRLAGDHPIT